MKTLNQTAKSSKKPKTGSNSSVDSSDSFKALIDIAQRDVDGVLHLFDTSLEGLSEAEAKRRLRKSWLNEIAREKPIAWYVQLLKTVTNPLSLLLIVLALKPQSPQGCGRLELALKSGLDLPTLCYQI
jgi:P-type Mg2+ transporter